MGYLIYAVIVIILAVALTPRPPGVEAPALSEINAPTADEGRPIPKVFGRRVIQSPNIVWYGDIGYNKVFKAGGK